MARTLEVAGVALGSDGSRSGGISAPVYHLLSIRIPWIITSLLEFIRCFA